MSTPKDPFLVLENWWDVLGVSPEVPASAPEEMRAELAALAEIFQTLHALYVHAPAGDYRLSLSVFWSLKDVEVPGGAQIDLAGTHSWRLLAFWEDAPPPGQAVQASVASDLSALEARLNAGPGLSSRAALIFCHVAASVDIPRAAGRPTSTALDLLRAIVREVLPQVLAHSKQLRMEESLSCDLQPATAPSGRLRM